MDEDKPTFHNLPNDADDGDDNDTDIYHINIILEYSASKNSVTRRERETKRQRNRQTERQTDRQRDLQTSLST